MWLPSALCDCACEFECGLISELVSHLATAFACQCLCEDAMSNLQNCFCYVKMLKLVFCSTLMIVNFELVFFDDEDLLE